MAKAKTARPAPTDPFEPKDEPARSIYLAFRDQAAKRKGLRLEAWIKSEREAVFAAARRQAKKIEGLVEPTIEDVHHAEIRATGHKDYGRRWVDGLLEIMREKARDLEPPVLAAKPQPELDATPQQESGPTPESIPDSTPESAPGSTEDASDDAPESIEAELETAP